MFFVLLPQIALEDFRFEILLFHCFLQESKLLLVNVHKVVLGHL
jgi:hypothetical protein